MLSHDIIRQRHIFLAFFFVESNFLFTFAVGVGRTRSGRRSVMLQTCGWKRGNFQARLIITLKMKKNGTIKKVCNKDRTGKLV